jgi:DNA-binding beta-propeller fold protein YncE
LDPATGKATGFLNVNESGKGSPVARWYDISHICVSPDGRYALVTESGFRGTTHGMGDVGRIVVVDLARMKVVYRSVVLPDLWCVDVAPDGKRALLAGSTRVYIWHPPFKL